VIDAVLSGIRMGKTQAFVRGLANTQRQYEVAKQRYDAIVRQLQNDQTNPALQQAAADAREDLEKAYKSYQNFGQRDAKAAGTSGDKAHQGMASKIWDHFKNFLVGDEHVPGNQFAALPGVLKQNYQTAPAAAAATPGNPPAMSEPRAVSVPGGPEVYAPPATMQQTGARAMPAPPPAGFVDPSSAAKFNQLNGMIGP
jgi:hypothetical protein